MINSVRAYALFETSRSLWAQGRRKEAIETAEEALSIFGRIEEPKRHSAWSPLQSGTFLGRA
jgi:hypothetical protein